MRLFNALTGSEVRQIILNEIARAFDQQPDFRPHITFPEIEWTWELRIKTYPREPGTLTMNGGAQYVEQSALGPDGTVDHGGAEERTVVLSGERAVTRDTQAPDEARLDNEMPISVAMPSNYGTVDHPVGRSVALDHGPRKLATQEGLQGIETAAAAKAAKRQSRPELPGQADFQVRRR